MPRSVLYPIKPGCFRPREDGTSIIHIQYCYFHQTKKKLLLDTQIIIPVAFWDKNNLQVKEGLPSIYGNVKKLNEALQDQIHLVEEMIKYAEKRNIENTGDLIKAHYTPDLDIYSLDELVKRERQEKIGRAIEEKKTELDVFHQIDLYIISKVKKVFKDMPRIYRNRRSIFWHTRKQEK